MHGSRATVGRTLAMLLLAHLCGEVTVLAQAWQVSQGQVGVVCPLTVGGRFEARTTSVTGTVTLTEGSRDVNGTFVVDLRTLDTGIRLRNDHLRDNYLEVARGPGYDTAVLDAIVLAAPPPGKVADYIPALAGNQRPSVSAECSRCTARVLPSRARPRCRTSATTST